MMKEFESKDKEKETSKSNEGELYLFKSKNPRFKLFKSLPYTFQKEKELNNNNFNYSINNNIDNNIKDMANNNIDLFETFYSIKDKKSYIALIKEKIIEIYDLIDNKKVFNKEVSQNRLLKIKYFTNNRDKEHLIVSDIEGNIFILDLTKSFEVLLKIEKTFNYNNISSFLVLYDKGKIFNTDSEDKSQNFLIFSSQKKKSSSNCQMYSLERGERLNQFLPENKTTTTDKIINNLIYWNDKINQKHYLIKFFQHQIDIDNMILKENYYSFSTKETFSTNGFIFSKNNEDFLCYCRFNGIVSIINLNKRQIEKEFKVPRTHLTNVINWNNKFVISSDYTNNNLIVIDIEENKAINFIREVPSDSTNWLKKIKIPVYGDCILTFGENNIIYLWIKF